MAIHWVYKLLRPITICGVVLGCVVFFCLMSHLITPGWHEYLRYQLYILDCVLNYRAFFANVEPYLTRCPLYRVFIPIKDSLFFRGDLVCVTCCPCGDSCRGLTTRLLRVGPTFGKSFLSKRVCKFDKFESIYFFFIANMHCWGR